jgi:hypothetical protein
MCDAANISDYIASNIWMINEWKKMGKEVVVD